MKGLSHPSEHDKDTQRKRDIRSETARIVIPPCKNPERRAACLADPELFLRTYFPERYKLEFGEDHLFMIETIVSRARHGGKQAVAAPRGRGKSELVKGLMVYLVCAEMIRFLLAVAATTPLAKRLYRDFRKKLATNDLLYEDFPEICHPIRELAGAPLRAQKQHVNGKLTQIVWTDDYISLAHVNGSPYGGVKMAYYGMDAAFRGANIDGDRPDFVLIDDPETRESAKSKMQCDDREAILDQDISGLASQEEHLAIVVLSTVQNDTPCLSAKLTDPKRKPAYNGRRFGMVVKWPDKLDLWNDYIAIRHSSQIAGDEHGGKATEFYLERRGEMDAGVKMISDFFKPVEVDGKQYVYSAIQQAFNQIADTSMEAYQTEYQNNPPKEEELETTRLTAARVQSRTSKFIQREVSTTSELRTVGIDIGNRQSHWTDIAWEGNAIGDIVDYGIMETHQQHEADDKAIELAILASLEVWADDVVSTINPLLVLVDSGSGRGHTQAVYEFCRRRGAPFFPSKGWSDSRFRLPVRSDSKEPFLETWAHKLVEEDVWLYNVNTEWWKRWTQQRFLTTPYDEGGNRTDGSMLLFNPGDDKKRHLSFAHHITAEEEHIVPQLGKESKRVWFVKNRNNHWLDATALACAAAGAVGVRLIDGPKPVQVIEKPIENTKPLTDQYGRSFVARR